MRISLLRIAAIIAASVAVACGGGSEPRQPAPSAGGAPASAPGGGAVSTDKNAYPVFPDADAGADPAVPAEQGGKGFTGQGWQTNANYELIGDPRAVKGGLFRDFIMDFPGTLRTEGPENNSELNYMIGPMVYESLLTNDPTTLDYLPLLATHWQISPDKMTYRYRIDPNARFSDGQPVTADDVVATWVFKMDKGLQDPSNQLVFGKLEKPVAESKYIVRVKAKQLNWRNFLYFSGMSIYPAHVLKTVEGATYLKDYNFKMLPGSGPYIVNESDVVKGKSVSIRRRADYWAEKHRLNVGVNNFDEVRETVVRDEKLAFEMFKKGDLDAYHVRISKDWVEEMNFDRVQRGLIQKRKVYNDEPNGPAGIGINTRKPPFDDVRVREAMAHLQNRALLIEKIFFGEYQPLNSYYPGLYENPSNPKMPFDPQLALKLLAEAGWKDHDAQGRLVKDGKPLTIELLYANKTHETHLTVYQEDLRKVGIGLNLRLVTPETLFKLIMERKFDTVFISWGGLVFPNPETSFHSQLADVDNNNNITGVKDKRIDELLAAYDKEFDPQKRIQLIREIDGILANLHHYVLAWYGPFTRIGYWNKFGHPDSYLTRMGGGAGSYHDMVTLWWIDPNMESQLKKAMGDPSAKLPVGETEVHYWTDYAQKHPMHAGAPAGQ